MCMEDLREIHWEGAGRSFRVEKIRIGRQKESMEALRSKKKFKWIKMYFLQNKQ